MQSRSSQTKSSSPPPSTASSEHRQQNLQDLIVLGLDYGATDEDLKDYFKQYGEVTHAEVWWQLLMYQLTLLKTIHRFF